MGNESGTWVMYGVAPDDPECIHTVDEAIEYINEIGFLPLFKNEIPGFSLILFNYILYNLFITRRLLWIICSRCLSPLSIIKILKSQIIQIIFDIIYTPLLLFI